MMSLIDEVMNDHVLPLFEGFEIAPDIEGHSSPPERLLTGRIELRSEHVTGSVGVCGSMAAIEESAPFAGVNPHDWVGELANLAAGRLKYGVLSLAHIRLKQSTPRVSSGDGLPSAGVATRVVRLRGVRGCLSVWLELEGLDDIESSTFTNKAVPAGKSILFD